MCRNRLSKKKVIKVTLHPITIQVVDIHNLILFDIDCKLCHDTFRQYTFFPLFLKFLFLTRGYYCLMGSTLAPHRYTRQRRCVKPEKDECVKNTTCLYILWTFGETCKVVTHQQSKNVFPRLTLLDRELYTLHSSKYTYLRLVGMY